MCGNFIHPAIAPRNRLLRVPENRLPPPKGVRRCRLALYNCSRTTLRVTLAAPRPEVLGRAALRDAALAASAAAKAAETSGATDSATRAASWARFTAHRDEERSAEAEYLRGLEVPERRDLLPYFRRALWIPESSEEPSSVRRISRARRD